MDEKPKPYKQDNFLNEIRKTKTFVRIFLINGAQVAGTIVAYDTFTIVLKIDDKVNMVYKSQISTIIPAKPMPLEG